MAVASRRFQQEMQALYDQMQADTALARARTEADVKLAQAAARAGHTTPQAAAKYKRGIKGMHPASAWIEDEPPIREAPATPLAIMASCEPDDFQDSQWETLFPAANYPYVQKYA